MATTRQTSGGVIYDIDSERFYVYVPERDVYIPLEQAAGFISQATLDAALLNYDAKGEGPYRFKGFIRLYSGTSIEIAADTRAALIRGVGGGGGGGGAQGGTDGGAAGGGGAGGAYFEAFKTNVAGQTLSYAIGAGGSAGSSSGGNGGTGGTTSITRSGTGGWTLSAEGGTGGNGQLNAHFSQASAGGFGQNASGGDINIGGQPGGGAIRLNTNNNLAGPGAGSPFGAGGQAFSGNAAGQQGLGQGAGGGGGAVADSSTGRAGGAGSAGYIEIWEFA